MWKKLKESFRIFGVVCGTFLFIISGLWSIRESIHIADNSVAATATVIKVIKFKGKLYPIIKYDGYTEETNTGAITDKLLGESFPVLYNKDNPREVVLGKGGDNAITIIYNNFITSILLAIGALLLFIYHLWDKKKSYQLNKVKPFQRYRNYYR